MKIVRIINGSLANNTFLIFKENKEAVIIDPSFDKEKIEQKIQENKLKIIAIFITHGHFDHIFSTCYFQKKYDTKVYLNSYDDFILKDPYGSVNNEFAKQEIVTSFDYEDLNDIKLFKEFDFEILHTPGHTPGSTCFYIKKLNVVFTGDTLFYNTIGATRFKKSDEKKLIASIKDKLFNLPNNTLVWPGHGDKTSIDFEKINNKYVNKKNK